jgi:hypothetical protein
MSTRLAFGVAALLVAGALALDSVRDSCRSESAAATSLGAEMEELRQRIEGEARRGDALAEELARVRASLAAIEAGGPGSSSPPGGAGSGGTPAGETEAQAADVAAASPALDPERGAGAFDASVLVAAGFREADVEALRARLDELQMDQLYLRDRASREGWLGTPRHDEEAGKLDVALQSLRGEFGEDLYDWMLYASGRPNRLAVIGLLEGSPAGAEGLRPGDVIRRYADRVVFDPEDLLQAGSAGSAGESAALDVERDGRTVRLYVPRGPLGARLELRSVSPQ